MALPQQLLIRRRSRRTRCGGASPPHTVCWGASVVAHKAYSPIAQGISGPWGAAVIRFGVENATPRQHRAYRGLGETQVVGRSDDGDGGVRAFGSVAREALNLGAGRRVEREHRIYRGPGVRRWEG